MNLLADESIDRQIVVRLRREGHTVLYVAEMGPGIYTDSHLLQRYCNFGNDPALDLALFPV
ncbi:MAG: DUF5615 family PIN-like protein [Anaerolineae bacterium]